MSFTSDVPLEVNQLPVSVEIPRNVEITEIVSLLYKRIARAVNSKTGSGYDLVEQGNFNFYYTPGQPYVYRPVYRYVFDLISLNGGNIAPGATVTFPHFIQSLTTATLIYASCVSAARDFFTVVYPNAFISGTQISFTNPLGATAITQCSFVAEYTKT